MGRKKICSCGFPSKWAADPELPIVFDSKTNEYNLRRNSGGYSVMRFCYWCGGALPKSKRDEFFHKMDKNEKRQMLRLLERIHNVGDMRKVLGPPDREVAYPPDDPVQQKIYGTPRAIRFYQYYNRWRTICLNFNEFKGKRVNASFAGKGKPETSEA